jgi:hypothetical protein
VRGNLDVGHWLEVCICGDGEGVVLGVLGERGDGGPSMMTTCSLLLPLLRGGSPKKADISKPPERLFLLGLGLSSTTSTSEGRPDDAEDLGGVFNCLTMNSDVGSP